MRRAGKWRCDDTSLVGADIHAAETVRIIYQSEMHESGVLQDHRIICHITLGAELSAI
jgi:hypothetical protein